jgi:hypothetical protein
VPTRSNVGGSWAVGSWRGRGNPIVRNYRSPSGAARHRRATPVGWARRSSRLREIAPRRGRCRFDPVSCAIPKHPALPVNGTDSGMRRLPGETLATAPGHLRRSPR